MNSSWGISFPATRSISTRHSISLPVAVMNSATKGLDVFIEAMYRLNLRLKEMVDPPTIVAFIITRAPVRNINVGVLQSQMQLEDLRSYCEQTSRRRWAARYSWPPPRGA